MKKITVVGAGYVGLVTAAGFANKGYKVCLVEKNKEILEKVSVGQTTFYEPRLEELLIEAKRRKNITYTERISEALLDQPEFIFICVGTPPDKNGAADLTSLWEVVNQIGRNLKGRSIIINKSTVPVGTTRRTQKIIENLLAQRDEKIEFDVASNPEFLREGSAVNDFLFPDRVVVGVSSESACDGLRSLYSDFIDNDSQFHYMNFESSELTKYAANVMLANKISFINQLSQLADATGADIDMVKLGISGDSRIGPHFLGAGIGYGGSCLPKDVCALIEMGRSNGIQMTIAEAVHQINIQQRNTFVSKITEHFGTELQSKRCGIWGLSFKPETDDVREAPSLEVVNKLSKRCSKVMVYDPITVENFKRNYVGGDISYATSPQQVLEQSDFLVILTEWNMFKSYSAKDFLMLADKTIFDGRNCFNPRKMLMAGISYFSFGRNAYGSGSKYDISSIKKPKTSAVNI